MILFSQYEAYFEKIAEDFKPISHSPAAPRFANMDIDDILAAQRTDMDFSSPCLILENHEGKLALKNDSIQDSAYGAFLIMKNVNRSDPEQKRQTLDLTKQLGMEILAFIHLQKKQMLEGTLRPLSFVSHFELDQVQYNKVGPLFSNSYGWRFEFNLGTQAIIQTNPENWP